MSAGRGSRTAGGRIADRAAREVATRQSRSARRRARTWVAACASLLLIAALVPAAVGAATTFSISGTVPDEAGAPAAGLTISTWASSRDAYVKTTTAADGTYTLAALAPGGYTIAVVDPAGRLQRGWYAATGFAVSLNDATAVTVTDADVTGIDIRYPHAYSVTGTVTTSTGTPLVGAGVVWTPREPECGNCKPSAYKADTIAGPGGSFSLHLVAGDYVLGFLSTESAPRVGPDWSAPFTVAGDVTGLTVRLAPTSLVGGRIVGPKSGYRYSVVGCSTDSWGPTIHTCDGNWDASTATSATTRFSIAVPAGKVVILFGGDTPFRSGNGGSQGVLPGLWSRSEGLVPTAARATELDLSHVDASGIDVTLQRLAISIHAGSSAGGSFGRAPVTVAAGSPVTLRVGLPRTFVGMKVDIQAAALDATGQPGTFRNVARRTVASDGTVVWTTTARHATAFRARYMPPIDLLWADPVLSSVVIARIK